MSTAEREWRDALHPASNAGPRCSKPVHSIEFHLEVCPAEFTQEVICCQLATFSDATSFSLWHAERVCSLQAHNNCMRPSAEETMMWLPNLRTATTSWKPIGLRTSKVPWHLP